MKRFLFCLAIAGILLFSVNAQTVYVSDGGNGDGSAITAPLGSLTAAFEALGAEGGEIRLCGTVTLPKNAIGTTQNAFVEPEHSGKVTLCGADSDACLLFGGVYQYHLSGETEFCDLILSSGAYTSGIDIAARGYPLTMGENLTMHSTGTVSGEVGTKIYLYGGCRAGVIRDGYEARSNELTVKSGSYWFIGGFNRNLNVTSTGRATLRLGGDVHTRFLIAGSTGTASFAAPSGADIFILGDLSVSQQISLGNQNSDTASFTTNLILQSGEITFAGSTIDYNARKRLTELSIFVNRNAAAALSSYNRLFAGYGDFEGSLSDYCLHVYGGHRYRDEVCTTCGLTRAAAECRNHDFAKAISGTLVTLTCQNCGFAVRSTEKAPAGSGVYAYTAGDVRVMILSERLIRIEERRGDAFTDGATLLVPSRAEFAGAPVALDGDDGMAVLRVGDTVVNLPKENATVADVVICTVDGEILFDYFAAEKNGFYAALPAPSATPEVWVLLDNGILPPAGGLTYTGSSDAASGWQRTENTDCYVFLPRGDAAALRSDFVALTGRTALSSIKTLGFWYSKWTTNTADEKLAMIERYRTSGHPLDMVVIDTEWKNTSTNGNDGDGTGYEINTELYPDMEKFLADANDAGVLVLFNDHTHQTSNLITDPTELAWQSSGIRSLLKKGLNGWWYDRNWTYGLKSPYSDVSYTTLGEVLYNDTIRAYNTETANGDAPARTLLLSNADWLKHGHTTNLPSVIGHRYGVQWTGDIYGDTVHLKQEIENVVTAGVTGASPYLSADLGGFRNTATSDNHFIRWMQFGALAPICRVHSTLSKANEQHPWSVGEAGEAIIGRYMDMRYHLLPYTYALAHENYESGMPLCRRLDFVYPEYAEAASNTEYLYGNDILVAPLWYTAGDGADVVPASWLGDGLTAVYYNIASTTSAANYFTGSPAVTTEVENLDFFWESDAPASGVNADWFTAVYTGKITPDADCYLGVLADDGARIYIDGELHVNALSGYSGKPVMNRSVPLSGGKTYDLRVEYLEKTGKARLYLLSEPILSADTSTRTVFFPDGDWMDVFTGEIITGPVTRQITKGIETSPIYVRKGAVLPTSAVISPMTSGDWQALTLNLYGAADGEILLCEDDGETEAYQSGDVRKTAIRATQNGERSTVEIGAASGAYSTEYGSRTLTFRIHGNVCAATFDGEPVALSAVAADPAAVPFAENGGDPAGQVYTVTVDADLATAHTFTYTLASADDLNGDGLVTLADALLLLRAVINKAPIEGGDLNGDGAVNLLDVLYLMKRMAN